MSDGCDGDDVDVSCFELLARLSGTLAGLAGWNALAYFDITILYIDIQYYTYLNDLIF